MTNSKDFQQLNELVKENPNQWTISCSVREVATGKEYFAHNGTKAIIPASNSKLFTTATILSKLSPNFRFCTRVYQQNDTLYIVGAGDPSISGRYYASRLEVFEQLYQQLKANGTLKDGMKVCGNDSLFPTHYPTDWKDSDKTYYYASEIGALVFNDNCIDLKTEGIDGTPIHYFPYDSDYINVKNQQKLVPKNESFIESYHRTPQGHTLTVKNQLPRGYTETESLPMPNPALFFADSFCKFLWEAHHLTAHPEAESKPRNWSQMKEVATHYSAPLSRMIETTHRRSNNLFAEMLLNSAVAYSQKSMCKPTEAVEALNAFIQKCGVSRTTQLTDGCGLSRSNRSSAADLSQFLAQIVSAKSPLSKDTINLWWHSLSSYTIIDQKMVKSKTATTLKAKTGTLSNVKALSGFITTSNQPKLAFSILIESSQPHHTFKSKSQSLIDKFVSILVETQ